MKDKEEPKDLLAELEILQRVLDDPNSSDAPEGDIPLLDDLFESNIPTINEPAEFNIARSPSDSSIQSVSDISEVNDVTTVGNLASTPGTQRSVSTTSKISANATAQIPDTRTSTPLNQINTLNRALDSINGNQEAKPDSISSVATNSTSKTSGKRSELDTNMAETTASLASLLQRERMVDQLVEELMPMVKSRLRARVRDMLNDEQES